MANPYNRSAALIVPPYGAGGGSGDNITSLASGAAGAIGIINAELLSLVTPLADILLPVWKITPGSGATGTISRYLICSEGTPTTPAQWTGNMSPITATNAAALGAMLVYDVAGTQAAFIDSVTVSGSYATYYFREQSLFGFLYNVPRFVSIVVSNGTNLAFNATAGNHSTDIVVDSYA
jgi:hypothetical protein